MSTVYPPFLVRGDSVSVIAPAGVPAGEALEAGMQRLSERFAPVRHREAFEGHGFLAGSDADRAAELRRAVEDGATRTILPVRGGFGTSRILNDVAFEPLARRPKWVVGSSDLTALMVSLWQRYQMVTLHGPMVAGYAHTAQVDVELLFDLLQGGAWPPLEGLTGLSPGLASGPLIGGNLTVLAHLAGTLPASFSDGTILFLEDVQERPYRLERCLTQLGRAGILDGIVGVVLGEFTGCGPGSDGTTWGEVMRRNLIPLGVPIAGGYPAAHGERNRPFLHGAPVHLRVEGESAASLTAVTDRF